MEQGGTMHYTSVLFSETDGGLYTGAADDLLNQRERSLKTGKGYRDLKQRITVWLTTVRGN
jgi:predicted GIY-YIG superfamily endonuclease